MNGLLSLQAAARKLRVTAKWLKAEAEGKAPAPLKLTPGRCGALRYRRADLERWIAAGCPDLRETEGGCNG